MELGERSRAAARNAYLLERIGIAPYSVTQQTTLRVLKSSSPTAQPLWLAFIWLVPLIGSLAALLSVRPARR